MDSSKIKDLLNISQNIRMLYVEDNKDARDAMLMMLKNFFPDITTAVDGEDGLIKYNSSTFDLILTDINMPKMNGIEMIELIREVSKEIPILILTAANQIDILSKTEKFNINGYLLKPIDMPQLIDTLLNTVQQINLNKICD